MAAAHFAVLALAVAGRLHVTISLMALLISLSSFLQPSQLFPLV